MERVNPKLPEAIKSRIAYKKTDQQTVAKRMGLTPATLNRKINGENDFKLTEVVMLKNILGLPWEAFAK